MAHNLPPSRKHDLPLFGLIENLLFLTVGEDLTAELFDTFHIGVITVVLDANVIIQDVCRYVKTRTSTGLVITAKIGLVRFFCSTDVRDEVLEHLPRVAGEVAEDALLAWRQVYAPLVSILDLSGLEELSREASLVLRSDHEDLPTAKLIDLIKPHAILSADHHLGPYHPTGKQWTQWSVAYRDKSKRDVTVLAAQLGGGVTISVTSSVIKGLIDLLLKIDRKVLLAIALALVASIGVAIAYPVSREWLKDRARATATWSSEHIARQLMALLDGLNIMDRMGKEAAVFLDEKQLDHPSARLVRDYIAEALARTFVPLTSSEIAQRIQSLGYGPRGEHPERYIATVLRNNPRLFEVRDSHCWTLRSHPGIG